MNVATDFGGSRERLGCLVGKGLVVVFGNEKNGHDWISLPFLRGRRRT